MKQSAEKPHSLASGSSGTTGKNSSGSLKDFFGGWLDSMAPELSKSSSSSSRVPTRGFKHSITANDMVRVNRATVRESSAHRHWPPDVVAQFLTAEVITRKGKRG
jgi:hypothetical protein